MDDATLEILLRVKEQNMEAFTEATAAINRVREALNKYREAEAAGLGADRAVKEALSDLWERGILAGESFGILKDQINDARSALTHYAEAVAVGMPVDAAEIAVINDTALSFEGEAVAADQAAASTQAASGAATGGMAGFIAMAAAIIGVAVAIGLLLPPLYLAISALTVLTSFAVAGAGMIALLGAIGLAVGGLGAATLALGIGGMGGTGAAANLATATANLQKAEAAIANAGGASVSQGAQNRLANAQRALAQWQALHQGTLSQAQQFTLQNLEARVAQAQQGMAPTGGATQTQIQNLANAQAAYNAALAQSRTPISIFLAHLTEMKQDFEKAAEPFAKLILQFADKALPAIEKLGMGIMQWFGQRIPGILSQISKIFKDLGPDFQTFGKFLSDLFDRNEGKIAPMAEAFIRFGLSLTTGLLSVLERLSNWFLERLPTFGPVVSGMMGGIGAFILGLAGAFGRFADYVVKNWPGWVKIITDAWNSKDAQDIRKNLPSDIADVRKSFEEIIKQAPVWVPQIVAVADAMVRIANSVLAIVGAMDRLNGWLQAHPQLGWLLGIGVNPGGGNGGDVGNRPSDNFTKSGYNSRGQQPGRQAPINIQINGAQNPAATGRAVVQQLRRLTQT